MNTKDREMLELAAKAAGIDAKFYHFDDVPSFYVQNPKANILDKWNPREDDAQCLQLARKLGINIDYEDCCAWKRLPGGLLYQAFWEQGAQEWWENDRDAVVAVAAEMGKLP